MAYQAVALNTIEDLAPAVRDFVNNNMPGWSAADLSPGADGSVRIQIDMPQGSSLSAPARSFVLAALNGGVSSSPPADNWLYVAYLNDSPFPNKAVSYAPLYPTGPGSADIGIRTASMVHLFWNQNGDAQSLSGVVEFGAGRYRHFWLGRLEKHGDYVGGDGFCSNQPVNWRGSSWYGPHSWQNAQQVHLFSGAGESFYPQRRGGQAGGIAVDHPGDPVKFREFAMPLSYNPLYNGSGDEVIGGPCDGVLDGLFFSGFHPATGKNILLPIELYAWQKPTLYALGHPVGVRLVNMRNLTPGAEFVVGTNTWMVFPDAHLDLVNEVVQYTTSEYLPEEENSGPVGYAYLKS